MYEYAVFMIVILVILFGVYKLTSNSQISGDKYYYFPYKINQRLTKLYYENQTKFYQLVSELRNDGFDVVQCSNGSTVVWCIRT